MSKEKTVTIAKKIEAFAIAFVGVCFFSIGTSYFQEHLLYRVPRILLPVFNLLGNVGLAIGMMILGAGLIYWGFSNWKSVSDKKSLFRIMAAIGLVVGVILANVDFGSKKSSEEIMEDMNKRREAQIDEVRNSGDLNFRDVEVDKHVAEFNTIYERYEQSIANKDAAAIGICEDEYMAWATKTGDIMQKLNNDQKADLARYLAKMSIQWSDLTMNQ